MARVPPGGAEQCPWPPNRTSAERRRKDTPEPCRLSTLHTKVTQPPDETSIGGELRPAGPVRLRLTERRLDDATVICVAGELDVLTAPRFASLVTEIIRTRPVAVIVDLRETDFLDSAGLHILLNA